MSDLVSDDPQRRAESRVGGIHAERPLPIVTDWSHVDDVLQAGGASKQITGIKNGNADTLDVIPDSGIDRIGIASGKVEVRHDDDEVVKITVGADEFGGDPGAGIRIWRPVVVDGVVRRAVVLDDSQVPFIFIEAGSVGSEADAWRQPEQLAEQ